MKCFCNAVVSVFAFVLVVTLTNCSSGASSAGPVLDTTAPTVAAVTPVDGTTDVSPTTTITATFSETMKVSTMIAANFTVSGATSGAVTGTVTYDDTAKTITFTPTVQLSHYDVYTATITTGATDSAGNAITSNHTWQFTIAAPSVLQVSSLQTPGSITTPIVVYDSSGDGIAVWEISSAGRILVYSLYDQGSDTWSAEATLAEQPDSTTSMGAQVISNGTGFGVVWFQTEGGIKNVYGRVYNGTSWATAKLLDVNDNSTSNIKIESNGDGYAAIWLQSDGSFTRLYAIVWTTTLGDWGAMAVPVDANASDVNGANIASNGDGYAVALRQADSGGAFSNAHIALWLPGSGWSTTNLETVVDNVTTIPVIASAGLGYGVVWVQHDGVSEYNLYGNIYYDPGAGYVWSGRSGVLDSLTINTPSNHLITSNGTGYGVVYTQTNSAAPVQTNVYGLINLAGNTTWSAAVALDTLETAPSYLTLSSDGVGYGVAWGQSNGVVVDVYAKIHNGTSWGAAQVLEAAAGNAQDVMITGNVTTGTYAATWRQQGVTYLDAYARVYSGGVWTGAGADLLETGDGDVTAPLITTTPNPAGYAVVWNQQDVSGTSATSFIGTYTSSWTAASTLVSSTSGGSSYQPKIISNGSGTTLAVWRQDNGSSSVLYANLHRNGSWGTPEQIAGDITSNVIVKLATNGTGFTVIWQNGNSSELFALVYDGTNWNTEHTFGTAGSPGQYEPKIQSNGETYIVMWMTPLNPTWYTYTSVYDGVDWSTPEQMYDSTLAPASLYDLYSYNSIGGQNIAVKDGNYGVTWTEYDGTYLLLYFNEYDSVTNTWGTPEKLEDQTGDWQSWEPQIFSNGSNYFIVWYSCRYDAACHYYGMFNSGAGWSTRQLLDDGSVNQANIVGVAYTNLGYAVAWNKFGATTDISARVYDGTAWSVVTTIATDVLVSQPIAPLIVSNGTGYAIVWNQQGDVTAKIYDSTCPGWCVETPIETVTGNVTDIKLISNGSGYSAVWRQEPGTSVYDIYINQFDGTDWTGESIIDTNTGSAFSPHLIRDGNRYSAIWVQPEASPADQAVRFPWARIGFE